MWWSNCVNAVNLREVAGPPLLYLFGGGDRVPLCACWGLRGSQDPLSTSLYLCCTCVVPAHLQYTIQWPLSTCERAHVTSLFNLMTSKPFPYVESQCVCWWYALSTSSHIKGEGSKSDFKLQDNCSTITKGTSYWTACPHHGLVRIL